MAQNIVASMSATISLDKQDALNQLIAFQKEAQTYTDKHKITYKFTSDKSDLERIAKEIEELSPELKAGVVLDFDATDYHKQIEQLNTFVSQDAKTIGKTFKTTMTKELKNMNLQNILNGQLGEGAEATKSNLTKVFNTLKAQTKGFDLSKVTSLNDITSQITALKQMSMVITELQKQGVVNIGKIKVNEALGKGITDELTNIYKNAGDIIAKNASAWASNLTQAYEKEFGSLQAIIANFAKGFDSAFSGDNSAKLEAITKEIKKQEAALTAAQQKAKKYADTLKNADMSRLKASVDKANKAYWDDQTEDTAKQLQEALQTYVGAGGDPKKLSDYREILDNYAFTKEQNPAGWVPIKEIQSLTDAAELANNEVAQLTKSLETLYSRKSALEQNATGDGGVWTGSSVNDDEVASLNAQLQEAKERLQTVTTELQKNKGDAEAFAEQLEYANQKLAEMQQRIDGFDKGQVSIVDFEKEQQEVQKLTRDLEGLYSILSKKEIENKELSDTVASQQKELDKAQHLENQLAANRQELELAKQSLKEQNAELDKAKAKYEAIVDRVENINKFLSNIKKYDVDGLKVATDALNKEYTKENSSYLKDKAAIYYGQYREAGGTEPLLMNDTDVTEQVMKRYIALRKEYSLAAKGGGKEAKQTFLEIQATVRAANEHVEALNKQNAKLKEQIKLLQEAERATDAMAGTETKVADTASTDGTKKKTKMTADEFKQAMMKSKGSTKSEVIPSDSAISGDKVKLVPDVSTFKEDAKKALDAITLDSKEVKLAPVVENDNQSEAPVEEAVKSQDKLQAELQETQREAQETATALSLLEEAMEMRNRGDVTDYDAGDYNFSRGMLEERRKQVEELQKKLDNFSGDKASSEFKSLQEDLRQLKIEFLALYTCVEDSFPDKVNLTNGQGVNKRVKSLYASLVSQQPKVNQTPLSSADSSIAEQNQLQAALQKTQQEAKETAVALSQIDKTTVDSPVSIPAINAESAAFDTVKQSVTELTGAIDKKTNAITQEKIAMDVAARSEIQSVQNVENEITELETKIRNLPNLTFDFSGLAKVNELSKLDLEKLTIKAGTLDDFTKLTSVLETLRNVLNAGFSQQLKDLKEGLSGLDFSGLNKLKLNKDSFAALSKLTDNDLDNLYLLAEILKDLKDIPALQTSNKDLLSGIKITKAQAENLTKAATGIITLKNSLTGFESVTASIGAIDTLITKIATLKGVVNNIKDIKVEVIEGETPGKTKTKVSDGSATKKQATEAQKAVENTEKLIDAYSKLEKTLSSINKLKIKSETGKATEEDQVKLNDLLKQEEQLRDEIEQRQVEGISTQEESLNNLREAETHLKALEQALKGDLADKTGGSVFELVGSDITAYKKALDIDPSKYINSKEITDVKAEIESLYKQMTDGAKRSAEANEILQKQFNEQVETLKKLANTDNLLDNNGKQHLGFVAGATDIEQSKDEIVAYLNTLGMGKVTFETFTRGHRSMIVSMKGSDGQVKKYEISLNNATSAIYGLYKGEKTYMSAGTKWVTGLKKKIYELTQYISGIGIITRIWTELRRGFEIIRELDTALTEMRKVSNETVTSLKNFQKASFDIAKTVGATASTIQNSTADFMRLGESLDEAAESAKVANILLNVSEFEDIDSATQSLVSMSQAFKELEKIDIVDKLNIIGNNFAISTDGLAIALQESASALKTAKNDLDESIALATAANAVVQDPNKVGAGLRTIALRITGTKAAREELKSLGEDVDDFVITTSSKLNEQVMDLTKTTGKMGVSLLDANGNYRSTYEILQDIADVWEKIAEEDLATGNNRQNALLELLAGKNRSNILASILQSPDVLRNAFETSSQDSVGSAQEELEKYLDSIDGKILQLTNNVQEFWSTFIDTEFVKNAIDVLSSIVQFGTNLIDTFGAFPTVLGAGAIAFTLFNKNGIGIFKTITDEATGATKVVNTFSETISKIKDFGWKEFWLGSDKIQVDVINDYNDAIKNSSDAQKTMAEYAEKANDETAKLIMKSNGATVSVKQQTNAIKATSRATKTATAATKAWAVAKNMLMNIGFSIAISMFTKAIYDFANASKTASEAADEAYEKSQEKVDSYKEEADSLEELISKYKELASTDDIDIDTREKIKEIQYEIADLVGEQASNLDLVNGKLDEELSKLKKITEENAKNAYDASIGNYYNSKQATNSAIGTSVSWGDYATAFGEERSNAYGGKKEKEVYDLLKNAGYDIYTEDHLWNGIYMYVSDMKDRDGNELNNAKVKAEYISEILTLLSEQGLRDTQAYTGLQIQYDKYKEYANNQQSAADTLLNNWINYSEKHNKQLSDILINSTGAVEQYKQKMLLAATTDDDISQAIADGMFSADDVENAINTFIATTSTFSEYYKNWYHEFITIPQREKTHKDFLQYLFGSNGVASATEAMDFNKLQSGGAFTDEGLQAYLDIRSTYSDEDTKYWSADKWLSKIQERISKRKFEVEPFNITSHEEQINDFQSTVSSLGDALSKLNDGSMTDGELVDFAQEFTELDIESQTLEQDIKDLIDESLDDLLSKMDNPPEGLVELLKAIAEEAKNATEKIKSLADGLSDLESKAQLRNDFKDIKDAGKAIDVSTLQDIAKTYPELEEAVAGYLAGLVSVDELYQSFDNLYQSDLSVYAEYLAAKNQDNEQYYSNLLGYLSDDIINKGNSYGVDLANYKSYNEAKLAMDKELAIKQAVLARKEAAKNSAKAKYEQTVKEADAGQRMNPSLSAYDEMTDATKEAEEATEDLDEYIKFLEEFDSSLKLSFSFDTLFGQKTGGNDTEKAKEVFDWYATAIERLKRDISNLDGTIDDDSKTLTERNEELKQQIDLTEDLKDAYGEAAEAYLTEFNAINLPQEYIEKIKNGTFDGESEIQKLDPNVESDASLIEKLEEAMPWYEKYLDAKDGELQAEADIRELRNKSLEDAAERYDWIEVKLDRIKKKIEDMGKNTSNTFIGYGDRKLGLADQIEETINNEIPALEKALKKYEEEAEDFDLSNKYKKLAKNGAYKIQDDLPKETAEKIDEYRELLVNIDETNDALNTSKESVRGWIEEWINFTESEANDKIGDLEQNITDLETALSNAAYTGANKSQIFDALAERQLTLADTARDSADALQEILDTLVALGELEEGSEAWQVFAGLIEGFRNSANEAELAAKDAVIQNFNDIAAEYDRILSDYEYRAQLIENDLARTEAKGYIANAEYYEKLVDNTVDAMLTNYEKKAALETELNELVDEGIIAEGSDKWHELNDSIEAVNLEIAEGELAILDYANAIRQIGWDVFDFLQDQISMVTNEADFLIDLMSKKDQYEDNGQLTDVGLAVMGQHGLNYNVYVEQAKNYAKEIKKINKELAKDPNDTAIIARKNELLETYQSLILAAEDEKYAIRDMVEEGINLELESLQTLIDKYNEALQVQKDLYDYQKKTANQSKTIAQLQKQLAAYAGDSSEEARAKIQQIRVKLEEAQSDMDDMQYDRYLSEQDELLSSLYDSYEEVLNQRLDNVDVLFEQMISDINTNSSAIANTIKTETDKVGYTLSDDMWNIWNSEYATLQSGIADIIGNIGDDSGVLASIDDILARLEGKYDQELEQSAQDRLNDYKDKQHGFETQMGLSKTVNRINTNLEEYFGFIESSWGALLALICEIDTTLLNLSSQLTEMGGSFREVDNTPSQPMPPVIPDVEPSTPSKPTTEEPKKSSTPKVGTVIKKATGTWYEASDGTGATGNVKLNGATSWEVEKINKGSKYPYHLISFNSKGKKVGSGWVKGSQIGYKTGTRRIDEDQLAWTQEEGTEVIFRKSDGAMLTPLGQGDAVWNATATQNLWDMSHNPGQFIRDSLSMTAAMPSIKPTAASGTVETSMNVEFVLPNVSDYNSFITQMQRDKKFEKMVQDMTINQLSGGSQMAKYRYKFS